MWITRGNEMCLRKQFPGKKCLNSSIITAYYIVMTRVDSFIMMRDEWWVWKRLQSILLRLIIVFDLSITASSIIKRVCITRILCLAAYCKLYIIITFDMFLTQINSEEDWSFCVLYARYKQKARNLLRTVL